WENRVNEENTVSINWSNLQKANEYIQKAKTIAKESGYSIQAGDKTSTLESLRKRYQKQTNYSSTRTGIHSLLEDVDDDFCDDIKVKLEDISLIDIMKLKTENISINQDDIVVIQDPNTYQGYTTKKVRKVEVTYEDIVKRKTIIDLTDDFNKYIKGIDDGIIEADKISEDEYMNAVLGSKFAHDMEADDFISGLSFVLDCIPVVGGIKNIAEACSGTTMTGEKLSDDERVMLGVGGLLSIGIDIATFGSLSGATTAAKVGSFTIKVGIETGQAMVIGLGSQYLMENGCNPLLAFAIMAGATVAGGAAFSKVTAKPSIKLDFDTLGSKGINNVDELAKHGITSMDDLAKLGVKNSDDLAKLGIKNADDLAKFGVNSLEDLKHIGLGDLATYKSIDDIFDSKKSFMDMMDATEAARYEKYLSSKLTDGLPPNMDMDDYLRYQKALNKLDEISAYNKVNGNAILDIRREADNLLKYGVKNSSDLGKLGITSIDDLTKLGIKNTDDLLRLGVKNIDDLKQVGIKGLDEVNSLDNVFKGSGYKSFDQNQFDDYIKEVENFTGTKLTQGQLDELTNALKNSDYGKLDADSLVNARKDFKKSKNNLISEWEINTGQKWPTYTEDVVSPTTGKVLRKAGDKYDAHHIIELSNGGDNSWWNLHPAKFPNEHQGGIHGTGSKANDLFK
ncbi:putative toxin of predicted polymorphic toxin system, partial [Breznakia blatticola]